MQCLFCSLIISGCGAACFSESCGAVFAFQQWYCSPVRVPLCLAESRRLRCGYPFNPRFLTCVWGHTVQNNTFLYGLNWEGKPYPGREITYFFWRARSGPHALNTISSTLHIVHPPSMFPVSLRCRPQPTPPHAPFIWSIYGACVYLLLWCEHCTVRQ